MMKRKSVLGLLCVCLAAVLVMAGCGGGKRPTTSKHSTTTKKPTFSSVGPVLMSRAALAAEATRLNQPIYWVGPLKGISYEFTRTSAGNSYVRYLPKGVKAGTKGASYLVVATYHFVGAYTGLKRVAKGKAVSGPGGSLVFVRPKDRKSVLIAFPGVPVQVEIYDPRPATSLRLAQSGHVRPVGS